MSLRGHAADPLQSERDSTFVPPPHSSDQTQACDLGLFGNLKAAQSRINVPDGMSLQSRQVIRITSAFQATCHPLAVTSAFRRAGISNVLRNGCLYAVVTPGTCSGVREPLAEWSQRVLPNRFDKARISIGEGTWTLGGAAPMPGSWAQPPVVREDTSEPCVCQDELAVVLLDSDDESEADEWGSHRGSSISIGRSIGDRSWFTPPRSEDVRGGKEIIRNPAGNRT